MSTNLIDVLPLWWVKIPCVGCGFCCASQPCPLAFIGGWWESGHCQMIYWGGNRCWCRVIELLLDTGSQYLAKNLMGVGFGCSADEDESTLWQAFIRKRSRADAAEIRSRATYEDETAEACLAEMCGGDETLISAVRELTEQANRLWGKSFVTKIEAERWMAT